MPLRMVFGFGDPPSRILPELHRRINVASGECPYLFQPIRLSLRDWERSYGIINSPDVLGCHFASPIDITLSPWLENLGHAALSSGRINVVYKDNGKLVGEDAQLSGSLRALQNSGFRIEGSTVMMLGTSSEAQSLALSLSELGMKQVLLLHHSVELVRAMAGTLKRGTPGLSVKIGSLLSENIADLVYGVDLLICSLSPHDILELKLGALPESVLAQLLIFDLGAKGSRAGGRLFADSTSATHPLRYIDSASLQYWQNSECYRLWNRQDPPPQILQQVIADTE